MAQKVKVYYAPSSVTEEDFEKNGFKKLPIEVTGDEVIYYKEFKIDKDSELVKNLISVYENPEWQKYAFNNLPFEEWVTSSMAPYYIGLGLNFERVHSDDGGDSVIKLIITDDLIETLTTWRLECILTDSERLYRIGPADLSFPNPLYPAKWIYKYLKEEIDELKSEGLLKQKMLAE